MHKSYAKRIYCMVVMKVENIKAFLNISQGVNQIFHDKILKTFWVLFFLSGSTLGTRHSGSERLRTRAASDAGRAAGRRGGHSNRLPCQEQTAAGRLLIRLNVISKCYLY